MTPTAWASPMSDPLRWLIWGLLLLSGGWLLHELQRQPELPPLPPALPADLALPVPTPPAPRAPALAAFPDTLARPLFAEDRRPVPSMDTRAEPGAAVTDGQATVPAWTLHGITRLNGHPVALLSRADSPRSRRLTLGDSLEGWVLADILDQAIVLQREGRQARLELRPPPSPTATGPP